MANTAVTRRAYPKRKRAQISYYEGSSDEDQVDGEYDASEEACSTTTTKRLKASRVSLSAKPIPKRYIFPFTSLPAEIKNQIYALVLTDPSGIFLKAKFKSYRRTVQRAVFPPSVPDQWRQYPGPSDTSANVALPALIPSVLLLDRAIHAETQPMLYAGNTFTLEDTAAMYAFLTTIGTKNCATLTDLTINRWGYTRGRKALNHPAFTMLAGALNLTRLRLNWAILEGRPKWAANLVYREAYHWLEAVGTARGKLDAAIEVLDICIRDTGLVYGLMDEWGKDNDLGLQSDFEYFKASLRTMLLGTKNGK